jgi:capsular exopolysaccharide synthesis family protein
MFKDAGIDRLRIFPAGNVPTNPAALLGRRKAAEVFDALRDIADFVIVDTPPVLAVADASVLAPLADGTVFVVDGSRVGRSTISQALRQLDNAGAHVIGAVYNNLDPSQHGSEYAFYSYYGEPEQEPNGRTGWKRGRTKVTSSASLSSSSTWDD